MYRKNSFKKLGWVESHAIFCYMLVCSAYITWLKQFKLWQVTTEVNNIMVVGARTQCALLYSICDLKIALINMQHSLIWKLMLYKFKLGYNAIEATKNICKNLKNQARLGWPKSMASKAQIQITEIYPAIVPLREYQVSLVSHSPV